jgi:hypothetical protein
MEERMENEIIEVKHENVALGSLMTQSPNDVIVVATGIADELAKIIKQKKLYKHIGTKDYVVVEGWNTLGAMLGVTARERMVNTIENGWEAYVELIRVSDGIVIGGASAICTRAERNWKDRDEFAVRSMTITRATGKAFRLSFSWIMALAGYEPTPAEEMDGVVIEGSFKDTPEKPVKKQSKASRPLSPEDLKAMIEKKAEIYGERIASQQQRGLMVAMLEACYAGDGADMNRHEVLRYLTGQASSKDLRGQYVIALLDWLKPEQDDGGQYKPDPMAAREAQTLLTAARKDAGQMELENAG